MPTTGWIKPTAAYQGNSSAQGVANILVSDDIYASLTHYTGTPGYMFCFFDDPIPHGSVITAIQARCECKQASGYNLEVFPTQGGVGNIQVGPSRTIDVLAAEGVRTAASVSYSAAESAAIQTGALTSNFVSFKIRTYSGTDGVVFYLDLFEIDITYTLPDPPTVTGISPAVGPIEGGTTVEIEGTLFQYDSEVTIGGVAATDVELVQNELIRCTTPAHAAGPVDVVVSNGGGDGTLEDGFTYLSVIDANVRLVKTGSFAGDDKADLVTVWPSNASYAEYGGAQDMWGLALTPDDVNAADFGVGIAAVVGTNANARVNHVEMEVHYSVPGVSDPQTYLSVLKVDADRRTTRPVLYQLPRAGYTVGNDPAIDRRTADAWLKSSRIFEPARYIEKTYRVVEFYLDLDPDQANTPGVQVWARVDDGAEYQLRDLGGYPTTLRDSGPQRVFFPASDAARGKYVQLEWRIPPLTGDQVKVAAAIRNIVLRFNYRPDTTEAHTMPLVLGKMPVKRDGTTAERRSPIQKLLTLIALAGPGSPPVQLRDALGRRVLVHITHVEYQEATFKGEEESDLLALVHYREADYGS